MSKKVMGDFGYHMTVNEMNEMNGPAGRIYTENEIKAKQKAREEERKKMLSNGFVPPIKSTDRQMRTLHGDGDFGAFRTHRFVNVRKKTTNKSNINSVAKQMNGTMGNDIKDFFSNVFKKATQQQQSTQQTPSINTAKETNDKTMTYLKYGAMAVGGVALVIVVMKMMKKK